MSDVSLFVTHQGDHAVRTSYTRFRYLGGRRFGASKTHDKRARDDLPKQGLERSWSALFPPSRTEDALG